MDTHWLLPDGAGLRVVGSWFAQNPVMPRQLQQVPMLALQCRRRSVGAGSGGSRGSGSRGEAARGGGGARLGFSHCGALGSR